MTRIGEVVIVVACVLAGLGAVALLAGCDYSDAVEPCDLAWPLVAPARMGESFDVPLDDAGAVSTCTRVRQTRNYAALYSCQPPAGHCVAAQ